MSVAFRRESDEEHKEPRFELPIPPGPNLVTRRGLALTEAKVAELEAALAAAPEAEREDVARTLRYWRTRKATAQLAPDPAGDEAAFGTRVFFRHDAKVRTVEIVGDDEAEPAEGRIAFSAPLARALIGVAPGERARFGGRDDAIEVLSVDPLEPLI
ncbi:GreA/GreB family elongation factor [Sphingomonas jatrophae]|uniref:Transcription elongation factor, GreA/GreB family n=1 Tax=Sphingomonas jatrophae TaxID=1166337 RepID=A0A1I6JCJ1_9SPHN|nr:GreA/GreB family elongation factor [Sphingomonas jatrophae]SFR76668.1 Transcription elongation factor, GreA/GreB family [Sphingomonas jatrophae]